MHLRHELAGGARPELRGKVRVDLVTVRRGPGRRGEERLLQHAEAHGKAAIGIDVDDSLPLALLALATYRSNPRCY